MWFQPGFWNGAPEEQILAETARAGYAGSFPLRRGDTRSPQEMLDAFARHGLKFAPLYLSAEYWDPNRLGDILERAQYLIRFSREIGCTEMFVGLRRTPERDRVAGRVRTEDGLSADGYKQVAEALNRVGELSLKQGIHSCLHSHVGSFCETRDEIDRIMSLVDPDLVFHGPDAGYLAWSGADPVQYFRDYADKIKAVHIKDINPAVREEGRRAGWDYRTFSDRGIFAEIGEGLVDFPAVLAELKKVDYKGWIVVEIDVTTKSSPFESVTISRENLRKMGV